ncbi:helix-turn-helix domain-containing protein [Actinacidiphila acidipaludis]|uniref:Helix-turn-helix domain-containing protein n=1 Tax=Actinacidiphila acidipaludis TaxID=2873382 RepID=A0ABS7Q9Z3_9ACTN|nr:helix-turn-helix domain-containing protein [Streptomyces acidipaludis]MBY8879783.1 helix-turn-helix domain-containing protein [Streptomyces acidipaludis]
MGTAVLGAVLRDMVGDDAVVDEVIAAARTSPEVARLPVAENRRHVAVLLASGLASFERPGTDPPDHDPVAALLGADRAEQGVPLTALLSGVQAGRRRALEIGVDRGRAAGVPDAVLLDALLHFDRHAGAMERHVISGYHTAQLELARTARDARTQVLRRLLHDGAEALPSDEIAQAGLDASARHHCVLSEVTDPVRARALERELAVPGALFGLVDGRFAGLTPRPPARPSAGQGPLVLVSPAVPLDGVPAAHRLCAAALATASAHGLSGTRRLTGLAAETALAAQPALAALLAGELLGALDPSDDFHRDLARTALTYLDLGHRLDLAAAALHVHPNTVRYRLTRLAGLTGIPDALDDPRVLPTLRWWWALRTWLDASRSNGTVSRATQRPAGSRRPGTE